jgi:hypothetical protein
MEENNFFTSIINDLNFLEDSTDKETEEEKRKREEEERLKLMQQSLQEEQSIVESKEEPIKKQIEVPVSVSDKEMFDSIINDLSNREEQEIDYTSLDGISTTRKIQYGAAQEPTIAGSSYRLLKAGVQSVFSDETFREAAQRIEKDRQEKILDEYPEFRGKKEDLTVLSGRLGVAVADPVTFFIPWAKIAKAGKITQAAIGAGVAGGDVALREKALYGDVSLGNVAIGSLFGAGSTALGNVIAKKIGASKQEEKLLTIDKDGNTVTTTLKNTDPVFTGPLPEKTQKALLEISEDAFVVSQPFINRFQDNLSTLGVKFQERDLIISEINRIKKKIAKSKTFENITLPSEVPALKGISPKRTPAEQKLINEYRSINDYDKQLITLQKEIDDITFVQQPKNIAIVGLHSLKKAYDAGQLKGKLGENLTRAMVHELVRPLAGATAGGLVGLTFSEGETDDALNRAIMSGLILGFANKRIENSQFKVSPRIRDTFLGELDLNFRKDFRTKAKILFAGSHSAKLQAENPVLQKFGADLFKIQGASTDIGEVAKEAVEELTAKAQDHYRKALYDITQNVDDETLLAAGRLVQQHKMPEKSKHSFLEKGDLENTEAVTVANKLLSLNKSFKEYVAKTGVFFKEEDAYGMTQILDTDMVKYLGREKSINVLTGAFRIQNRNQNLIDDTVKLLDTKELKQKAINYLDGSDNIRRTEIVNAQILEDNMLRMIKNNGKVTKDNETIIQSARFFDNERVLFDQEARAYAKQLFIQDPEFTNLRLFENTIPVTEFARRFGSQGQGLKDVINDLKKYYSQFGDIETNLSLKKLINQDIKTISDTVNANFKVYGLNQFGSQSDAWRTTVLAVQALLSTTKLVKVALPSLGDLVQVMQNGSYKSAFNSYVKQFKTFRKDSVKPSESLALRGGNIKEGILGRKFSNRRYNGALQKELSDFNLTANTNTQKNILRYQERFFEIVQLGRITRFAREFAYDAGAFRAFDLGVLANKGKLKPARLRELKSQLGLTEENAKYLGQFKSMDEAYADKTGKILLDRAGRKAADRDALIPTVGNRRLFSQSNNPSVKFLGSFLSWAQAKSSQTNSLLRRIEDGDAKLAVMMLASLPIYATIRQLQVAINPNEEFRKDFGRPFESKENFLKFLGDTGIFSGQFLPFWADKIFSSLRYNKDDAIESLYPAAGMINDFWSVGTGAVEGKPISSTVKFIETSVPLAKEITRREAVGEAVGLDTSLYEAAKIKEKEITPIPQYATGGLVRQQYFKGEEVSKDFPVTDVKETAADRVDPFTGQPYSAQMEELGLDVFQER